MYCLSRGCLDYDWWDWCEGTVVLVIQDTGHWEPMSRDVSTKGTKVVGEIAERRG